MLAKRVFDLAFTIPGIILLSPLFFLICIWIKLEKMGPVFFRQIRVGRFGKTFWMYKFRTMVVDAESCGQQITVRNDARITRSGRVLRKYKLDELPQLFNVLKGEMSLVGPRPEVPQYVSEYPDDVKNIVLSVPPGITDYASIEYKDENQVLNNAADSNSVYINEVLPIKLSHYVRYVKERSVWVDFLLILKTFSAILFGRPDVTGKSSIGLHGR